MGFLGKNKLVNCKKKNLSKNEQGKTTLANILKIHRLTYYILQTIFGFFLIM
jgi:hypothetical protein